MLDHLNDAERAPPRVVVIGAQGFVGAAIVKRLMRDGIPVLGVGRSDVDLTAPNAAELLGRALRAGDSVVAVSAVAPCINADMLVENMIIARALATALAASNPTHVVNISSDAVYADSLDPLTEESPTSPSSIHGAMHLAREVLLRAMVTAPFVTLRPTLIYGAADPHNGYGPNRFIRAAKAGKPIVLFGGGEERRDHVFIDDVAEIASRAVLRRSVGELNVVTGATHSFRSIAERVSAFAAPRTTIESLPRSGPMPHNGYRPFDPSAIHRAFPDIALTPLDAGLERMRNEIPNGPARA